MKFLRVNLDKNCRAIIIINLESDEGDQHDGKNLNLRKCQARHRSSSGIANIFIKIVSSMSPTCTVMDYGIVVLCALLALVESKEITTSGKLDFGDEVKNEKVVTLHIPTSSKHTDNEAAPSEITSSVICGSNGCNTTNTNNSIETQILVHVKTRVNLDKTSDQKVVENSSDVPVVAGYSSGADEAEKRENSLPSLNYEPKQNFPYRPFYSDENGRRHPSEIPFYSDSRPFSDNRNIPLGPPYHSSYGPSSIRPPIDRFYSSTSVPYKPFDYDLNSVLPITPPPNFGRRNYENNFRKTGIEQRMPYFGHTYNNHHFSEEAPPHTIWVGNDNTRNPVEFRTAPRDQWRPTFLNDIGGSKSRFGTEEERNFGSSQFDLPNNEPLYRRRTYGTECSCREQRSTASRPYAAASNNQPIFVTRKSRIDNKLGTLKT